MQILVIDVGTSSMRGILYREDGQVLTQQQRSYQVERSGDSVEQDAALLGENMEDIIRAIAAEWRMDAISLTAQRSSVIALGRDGQPLHKALMWQDKRSAAICQTLQGQAAQIYSICGMKPTPVFSAPKMQWMKENLPEVYKKAEKLVGFQEYLLHQMTGQYCTDSSLASRTCLYDISRQQWSEELVDCFGLDKAKLCQLVPVGSVCGQTTPEFNRRCGLPNGIPVVSAGGDQQCAAMGLGCVQGGSAEVNSGTGSFLIALCQQPVFDPKMRVMCNVSAIEGLWILEGATLSSGTALQWLNQLLFPESGDSFQAFDQACRTVPPGANGLLCVPSFAGKGAPDWDSWTRGVFHNLRLDHTRGEFARALLEGIAGEMWDCLEVVQELLEGQVAQLYSAGGLTKNPDYNQLLADNLNLPVYNPSNREATSLGGWISAAVALGLYGSYQQAHKAVGTAARQYRPNPERTAVYRRHNAARRYLYESIDAQHLQQLLQGDR